MNPFGVHQPVMLREVMSSLNVKRGSVVLDATTGGGGHSRKLLESIIPEGRLIGLDADEVAIQIAEEGLKDLVPYYSLIKGNFKYLDRILSERGQGKFDAILFDLGISSYQLEDGGRGFSIKHNARLDMRMDRTLSLSAYDVVNRYLERELDDIIGRFGEERFHRRIAKTIAEERAKRPIETTYELAAVIYKAVGRQYRDRRIDPATRTFQAIRIAVNDELNALEEGLKQAISWLKPQGRVCVISFHSLEDRIVKNLFKGYAALGILKILTKKPLRPSHEEIVKNPRARSAKLRVAERME